MELSFTFIRLDGTTPPLIEAEIIRSNDDGLFEDSRNKDKEIFLIKFPQTGYPFYRDKETIQVTLKDFKITSKYRYEKVSKKVISLPLASWDYDEVPNEPGLNVEYKEYNDLYMRGVFEIDSFNVELPDRFLQVNKKFLEYSLANGEKWKRTKSRESKNLDTSEIFYRKIDIYTTLYLVKYRIDNANIESISLKEGKPVYRAELIEVDFYSKAEYDTFVAIIKAGDNSCYYINQEKKEIYIDKSIKLTSDTVFFYDMDGVSYAISGEYSRFFILGEQVQNGIFKFNPNLGLECLDIKSQPVQDETLFPKISSIFQSTIADLDIFKNQISKNLMSSKFLSKATGGSGLPPVITSSISIEVNPGLFFMEIADGVKVYGFDPRKGEIRIEKISFLFDKDKVFGSDTIVNDITVNIPQALVTTEFFNAVYNGEESALPEYKRVDFKSSSSFRLEHIFIVLEPDDRNNIGSVTKLFAIPSLKYKYISNDLYAVDPYWDLVFPIEVVGDTVYAGTPAKNVSQAVALLQGYPLLRFDNDLSMPGKFVYKTTFNGMDRIKFGGRLTPPPPPVDLVYNSGKDAIIAGSSDINFIPSIDDKGAGSPIFYEVTPALPSGMVLDSKSGVISGIAPNTIIDSYFTIKATNIYGSTSTLLRISIYLRVPPSDLKYSVGEYATLVTGAKFLARSTITISSAPPDIQGDLVYSVNPALPSGITLDERTGTISGETTLVGDTVHTINATNNFGFTSTELRIEVIQAIPPSNLVYNSGQPVSVRTGTNIDLIPTIVPGNGTSRFTYSIEPELPPDMVFNSNDGRIGGVTPGTPFEGTYVITATNNYGSTTTTFRMIVFERIPSSGLVYNSGNDLVAIEGSSISCFPEITEGNSGENPNYSIVPALPNGLLIDSVTGEISGIAPSLQNDTTYTITATDGYGSISTQFRIVILVKIPPSNLVYNSGKVAREPSNKTVSYIPTIKIGNGTKPLTFSILPELPPTLSIDSNTGVISGRTDFQESAIVYTITATNDYGTTSYQFEIITIFPIEPSNLEYNGGNPAVAKPSAQVSYAPSIIVGNGFEPLVYTITPTLPSGISMNTETGVISGTTPEFEFEEEFFITATNDFGSATAFFRIQISVIEEKVTDVSWDGFDNFALAVTSHIKNTISRVDLRRKSDNVIAQSWYMNEIITYGEITPPIRITDNSNHVLGISHPTPGTDVIISGGVMKVGGITVSIPKITININFSAMTYFMGMYDPSTPHGFGVLECEIYDGTINLEYTRLALMYDIHYLKIPQFKAGVSNYGSIYRKLTIGVKESDLNAVFSGGDAPYYVIQKIDGNFIAVQVPSIEVQPIIQSGGTLLNIDKTSEFDSKKKTTITGYTYSKEHCNLILLPQGNYIFQTNGLADQNVITIDGKQYRSYYNIDFQHPLIDATKEITKVGVN